MVRGRRCNRPRTVARGARRLPAAVHLRGHARLRAQMRKSESYWELTLGGMECLTASECCGVPLRRVITPVSWTRWHAPCFGSPRGVAEPERPPGPAGCEVKASRRVMEREASSFVLLVDRDIDALRTLTSQLQDLGRYAQGFTSPRAALQFAADAGPAPCLAVVVDDGHPDVLPTDALCRLSSRYPRAVAVLTGAPANARTIVNYLSLGWSYLPKPYDAKSLLEYITIAGVRALTQKLSSFAGCCRLAPREKQLLLSAFQGLNNDEAASELGCSRATVSTYWNRIFRKVGVRSQRDVFVALCAFQSGMPLGVPIPCVQGDLSFRAGAPMALEPPQSRRHFVHDATSKRGHRRGSASGPEPTGSLPTCSPTPTPRAVGAR
jgi:DNA-binding NarL/FixJ family response regulator